MALQEELTPGPGHNEPPLEAQIATFKEEVSAKAIPFKSELLDLRTEAMTVPESIDDEDTARLATDFVKKCRAARKAADEFFAGEKRPLYLKGKAVDDLKRLHLEPFDRLMKPILDALTVFQVAKEDAERKRRAEEQARLEAEKREAERKAREAEAEAKRLANEGDDAGAAAALTASDEAEAELATLQKTRVEDRSKTRGDYGGTAFTAGRWVFEITDMNKLPDEFWIPDEKAIREFMLGEVKEGRDPALAGVTFTRERTAQVR